MAAPILGDILYRAASLWTRLAGNTTTTKKFLRQTGTGSGSAAPAWDTLVASDLPNTTVTPGSYTNADITVDAQGRLTAAANGSSGGGGTVTTTGSPASGNFVKFSGAASITPLSLINIPQGRLTLTTGVPWMIADVTAATTIYYTPAVGAFVPIYDGTLWTPTLFSELSQTTTDSTKSPAAVGNNSNYDLFVWNDSGTLRCTRGPAWSSDTSRGSGAGTTELESVNGILMNKVAITNGPGADRGTYVGSVRSNGSAKIDVIFGGAGGAGGDGTILGIWNMYNRRLVDLTNFDNTDSWNYTTATFRLKNAGTSTEANKIKFLIGVQGDGISATNHGVAGNSTAGITAEVSIGLNSTSTPSGSVGIGRSPNANNGFEMNSIYSGAAPLGFNYLAPLEFSNATGVQTWFGDGGITGQPQSLFTARTMF